MEEQVIAGRYRLERQLGSGGMSEVWAAEDLELDRTVAVKLLGADADPARFEREARAAAALSHPNISALYDYGQDAGRRYMILEYLPGGTLEDRLATGEPMPDEEAGRISREVAAGLAHAHDRGLVHRDLKPSNILFDREGRAKIADFGIARMAASTGLTEAGTVMGTAAYIAPEQAAGLEATPASDVYAFGVILFRMLTGRLPFESPDALALAAMHRDREPPAVAEFRPDAPPLLESIATAALAKSPGDRPADGRALLAELGHGAPPPVADDTAATQLFTPVPPPRRRRRTVLIAIAVAVLAAAGVGLAVGLGSDDGGPATATTSPEPSTTRPTTASTTAPSTSSDTTSTTTEATTSSTVESTTTPPVTTAPPPLTTTPVTTAAPPPTTAPPTTEATVPETTTAITTTPDTTPTTTTTTDTTTTPAPPVTESTTPTVTG